MSSRTRAILLLSGGLDSATVLALAKEDGFDVFALSFDYGQRHSKELEAARRLAEYFRVCDHLVVRLDRRVFGRSLLAGGERHFGPGSAPPTYVPARNTVFLAHAIAWAEVVGAGDIFVGPNADDAADYPDCRKAYLDTVERAAILGTYAGTTRGLRIRAPLIDKSKREVAALARALGVPIELTWSCYFPTTDGSACGVCHACQLRNDALGEQTT